MMKASGWTQTKKWTQTHTCIFISLLYFFLMLVLYLYELKWVISKKKQYYRDTYKHPITYKHYQNIQDKKDNTSLSHKMGKNVVLTFFVCLKIKCEFFFLDSMNCNVKIYVSEKLSQSRVWTLRPTQWKHHNNSNISQTENIVEMFVFIK